MVPPQQRDQHWPTSRFDASIQKYQCVCGGSWLVVRGMEPRHIDRVPSHDDVPSLGVYSGQGDEA